MASFKSDGNLHVSGLVISQTPFAVAAVLITFRGTDRVFWSLYDVICSSQLGQTSLPADLPTPLCDRDKDL